MAAEATVVPRLDNRLQVHPVPPVAREDLRTLAVQVVPVAPAVRVVLRTPVAQLVPEVAPKRTA